VNLVPSRSTRVPLSPTEIAALDAALIEAYRLHTQSRERTTIAATIARPPIPAALSESIVALAAPLLFGEGATAAYGGREADLVITRANKTRALIEVKATGTSAFQEIKERDLVRDALVWVAFGTRYVEGSGAIEMHVLPEPARYRPVRRKLSLDAFLTGASSLPQFVTHRFETLDELIALAESLDRARVPGGQAVRAGDGPSNRVRRGLPRRPVSG
jgi:hypothetical protein